MDNPEYEKFLLDVADDVVKLVAVPENRRRFEQHSCDLGNKQAAYSQARERAAKQMPPDPLAGFLSVLTYTKDNPDEPTQLKIDEALAYYYFSLATIHDKMREGYTPIHNDSWARQLANTGVWPIIENLCVDRQFIIKTALDHVKADLEKPTETEQSETLVSCVTIGDIEELLELFRQLDNLLEPALPPKDDSLWCEAKKEAQEELSEQLKERRSTFSERPGLNVPPRKATRMKQRKYQQQVENRIFAIAEKKYCERDQAYSKAVDTAKRTVADVLKKIDHLLACTGGVLQRFSRTKDTWLVENFKEIRKSYDWMVKDNIKYSVRETIDALEALKLKYERLERLDTQKEHKVHPCKKKTKTSPLTWLKNHPHSYSLQGGIILLIICVTVGLFKPQWHWGSAAFTIIVLILSLLGGPGKK